MIRPLSIYPIHPRNSKYQTCGNWEHHARHDEITCAEIEGIDPRSVRLVQFHELIEMWLSDIAGVKEEDVTNFDTSHPELDEPGDDPLAPYFAQHAAAMDLERRLCAYMGLTWEEHEENVAKIADAVDVALQSKTSTPQG